MNEVQDCPMGARNLLQRLSGVALLAAAPLVYGATLIAQPQVGEPTTKVDFRGNGMSAFETVEFRYDGARIGVAYANAAGAFKADDVVIPASALPGRRTVSAVGRSSGNRATVSFLVRTNWPQFHRGSFRHGETSHENVLGPDNVVQLRLLWSVQAGVHVYDAMQGSLVVADGVVFIIASSAAQGRLLALDAATGARRWSQPIGPSYPSRWCGATPAVAQGLVYAPAWGRMVAYDARSGAVRWRAGNSFCGAGATPTVVNGKLFTNSANDYADVEARDAASGRLLWSSKPCIGTPASCTIASVAAPLAAGDGIVYMTNHNAGMAAYEASTGRQLWSRVVGPGSIDSAPVVEGDVVYVSVAMHDGRLYALNRRTGAELWWAPTGYYNHSTPALADGLLYVGSDGQGVTAVDAKTGAIRWQQNALGTVRTSPAVANGVVYLGADDGRLYALDARTGTILHSRQIAPVGRLLSPSPAVVDGVVYVSTGDEVLAFGLKPRAAEAGR